MFSTELSPANEKEIVFYFILQHFTGFSLNSNILYVFASVHIIQYKA